MNILLFGPTGSIGAYLNKNLQEEGHKVFTCHRYGADYYYDFTAPDQTQSLEKINVALDAVIFAQGINPSVGMHELDLGHYRKMFDINIIGPSYVLHTLENKLNDNASVIFFSSIAARKGSYDPGYAASKAAINGLVLTLSNYFNNVRVNALSLGLVEGSKVEQGMTEDFKDRHKSSMHGHQLIKLENIYGMVYQLLNNNNLNRTNISLDGGFKV